MKSQETTKIPPLKTIEKNDALPKSDAIQIRELLRKRKKFLKSYYDVAPFKEPILLFERRSGDVEFYEDVTSGLFEYTHSDGGKRFQIIEPRQQKRYGFGSRSFRGYYSHEDYPTAGLPDPLLTSEQVNLMIEKALNDIANWRTKSLNAWGNLSWKVLGGIALIVAVIAIAILVIQPQMGGGGTTTVVQVINATPQIIG